MRYAIPAGRPIVETLERRTLLCAAPIGSHEQGVAGEPSFGPLGPEAHVGNGLGAVVATDAAGNFVVAWAGSDDAGPGVFARRYTATATPAGEAFRISTINGDNASIAENASIVVAMDADGDFVVVWSGLADDGSGPGVYARRVTAAGDAPGAAVRVNTASTASRFSPAIAMSAGGEFVITWNGFAHDGAGSDIYARSYDAAGEAQRGEFRANATIDGNETSASVAMSDAGDFVIAWQRAPRVPGPPPVGHHLCPFCYTYAAPLPDARSDDSGAGVYAQRFSAAGNPVGEEFLVSSDSHTGSLTVAIGVGGDFIIARHNWRGPTGCPADGRWCPQDPGTIFAQRYDAAGQRQGEEFFVAAGGFPSIAVGADGSFVVAWDVTVRSFFDLTLHSSVHARGFTAGGEPIGDAVRVATTTARWMAPSVAMDTDGDVVIVWNDDVNGVHAQRYAELPPRVTGVFVGSTAWTPAFNDALQARGLGDATFGNAIPGGPGQLDVLPWDNIDTISIRFSRDLAASKSHLVVTGVNVPVYSIGEFAYHADSHTATWKLSQPLGKDRLTLRLARRERIDDDSVGVGIPWGSWWGAGTSTGTVPDRGVIAAGLDLDGEWSDGSGDFPSGDGTPGGDFRFAINVLPGDTTGDGRVLARDYAEVKKRFFTNTASPVTGAGADYSPFHDIDGSGSILARDFAAVKAHFFDRLPEPQSEYGGPAVPIWAWGSVSRSGTSWLYGT